MTSSGRLQNSRRGHGNLILVFLGSPLRTWSFQHVHSRPWGAASRSPNFLPAGLGVPTYEGICSRQQMGTNGQIVEGSPPGEMPLPAGRGEERARDSSTVIA